MTQGGVAPPFFRFVRGAGERLRAVLALQGVGLRPPRRADLAPRKSAEQAVPDRPVHGADFAQGALNTSIQACLQHAGALAARRGSGASLVFVARCPGLRLSLSFITDPATVARGACPSRRAGPSPRLWLRAAPLPALASLTASPSLARVFAGDELRKDGDE